MSQFKITPFEAIRTEFLLLDGMKALHEKELNQNSIDITKLNKLENGIQEEKIKIAKLYIGTLESKPGNEKLKAISVLHDKDYEGLIYEMNSSTPERKRVAKRVIFEKFFEEIESSYTFIDRLQNGKKPVLEDVGVSSLEVYLREFDDFDITTLDLKKVDIMNALLYDWEENVK